MASNILQHPLQGVLQLVLTALDMHAGEKRLIVAIDGPCGSGKTTLAQLLAHTLNAPCVHMDDFHVPHALKTPERMAQPGGNSDRERLLQEVVLPWKMGNAVSYRAYDCGRDELLPPVSLQPGSLLILEGSYSHHPELAAYTDVQVFVRVSRDEQLRRIQRRCPEKLDMFMTRWIPLEDRYFAAYQLPVPPAVVIHNESVQGI